MRILLFLALLCFGASYSSVLYSPCSSGPKFWCSNLANAKLCGAVSHCIQTVWENEEVAEDTDSVCQICLDMVKQARDQLESNETISDLKAVFEGSCKLIPVKPVQKECIKLADDFIPELVEALASQMNPQMVCSVAGLCNNAAIDKMLEEQKKKPVYVGKSLTCNNCNVLSNSIIEKFNNTHRDQVLDNIQDLCGKMSSFSDACNSIVLTHFNTFYQQIQEKISSDAVCHMSGVCSWKFHSHAENDDMKELSSEVVAGDDLPCELCQQLVRHLRDVLIANTTEDEFKQVLQGLCGQTKGFKTECLSIVDEYYKIIYETLVNNLDASGACFLIGICPKGETVFKPIAPAKIDVKITKLETVPSLSNAEISSMQKPLNSLFETEMSTHLVENGELCTLCEYFMHFVQETLTLPSNEKKIKDDLKLICSKSMPKTLKGECDDFVDMYGDAVVALLVQEIDPRQICPFMRMCSPNTVEEEKEVTDKPSCPLCLFAVEQAQIKIKDDKTKENAIKVLNNLCNHFPNNKLKAECVDFVKTYTSELINLLVQDFTPQQICVAIKLCENNKFDLKSLGIEVVKKELDYNEEAPMPQCLLCKKVIELVEKELIGEKTKENIMEALRRTCSKLKRGQKNCNKFVEKYGELIADLILKEMKPDQICKELLYCLSEEEEMDEIEISIVSLPEEKQTDPPSCAVCEIIMTQMEHELKDKKTQDEIRAALQNVCHKIPSSLSEKCTKIIDDYTETILNLLNTIPPKQICQEIKLCSKKPTKIEKPTQDPQCTICELIMTQLEQELKDKKTKEEVKTALENICHKIPSKFSDKCSKIVDQYSDAILDMLDSVPPKEICSRMNLCAMNDISNDILECGVCQGVSAFLVSHKDTELTKNEMKDLTCDSFPSKYFDKCTEIIEYYSQSIQNLIKSNISENEICTKIGKCFDKEGKHSYQVVMNSHKSKRTLVGDNECTFGPSHWCKDKETAKKCDLVDYCEKIWKKKENKTA